MESDWLRASSSTDNISLLIHQTFVYLAIIVLIALAIFLQLNNFSAIIIANEILRLSDPFNSLTLEQTSLMITSCNNKFFC